MGRKHREGRPGPTPPRVRASSRATRKRQSIRPEAPGDWLASDWSPARGRGQGCPSYGCQGRGRTCLRTQWSRGRRDPPGGGSLSERGVLPSGGAFSCHVRCPAAATAYWVGSMSAAVAARKRGKPVGAAAGAGKRRRKVRMAFPWAAVCLITGATAFLSEKSEPGPFPSSGASFSSLHPPDPGKICN